MTMNNLPTPYNIAKDGEHVVSFSVDVSAELPFFPGHFPQENVLPGVVMVDWVVNFAEQLLPVKISFKGMEAIKFKQVVRPPETLEIKLTYKPEKQKLIYNITSASGEHSSGKIGLCEAAK